MVEKSPADEFNFDRNPANRAPAGPARAVDADADFDVHEAISQPNRLAAESEGVDHKLNQITWHLSRYTIPHQSEDSHD